MKNLKLANIKKLLYIIIFLVISVDCLIAQERYQSFFGDSSTTYHIFSTLTSKSTDPNPSLLGIGFTFQYSFTPNDTIRMNDYLYYRIPRLIHFPIFVREDTLSGKIFRYFPEEEEEFLICDMSLTVGDTFQFPYIFLNLEGYYYYYAEAGAKVTVDSISYTNGRKIIYLSPIIWNSTSYSCFYSSYHEAIGLRLAFIEGIGPSYGPFGFIAVGGDERHLGVLLCVDKNDTLTYMTSDTLGCLQFGSGIPELEKKGMSIYPNPAENYIIVELPDGKSKGIVDIIDNMGNCIYTIKVHENHLRINLSNLSSGIYIIRYHCNQEIITSKFIKL